MMSSGPAVFAATFGALYAAHAFGDHWLQRSAEAVGKAARTWTGRALCARHVATLTLTKVVALVAVATVSGVPMRPAMVAIALTIDAVSHYWADRRTTLAKLAHATGKGEFYQLGDGMAAPCGTGAYSLDQSWHVTWLFIAALIISAS